jgi:hypothetical protein
VQAYRPVREGSFRRMSVIHGMNAARNPTERTLKRILSQVILSVSLILTEISILPTKSGPLYESLKHYSSRYAGSIRYTG